MNSIKRSFLSAVIVASLVTTIGCRPGQMQAAGVGAVVGLFAFMALSQADYNRMPQAPRHVPRYSRCTQYYQEGWTVYQTPYGHYIRQGYQQYSVQCMSNVAPAKVSAEAVAQILETDVQSANELLAALDKGEDGDMSAIEDLGLSEDDILAFARYTMISDEGLGRVGAALKHDSKETTMRVIQKLIDGAHERRALLDQRDSA